MRDTTSFPPHHAVYHEAMKTTYVLRLCGGDEALLRSLASESVERIDELERKLSRYVDGGDVFRVNRLDKGETLRISEECHECLLQSLEASIHTGGLFDPTLGSMIEHRKRGREGAMPEARGQLSIHPDTPAVTCIEPGRQIDLGGIGKGFTLDQLARYLSEWDIGGALLSAGASTHLAFGEQSWPIDLVSENDVLCVELENGAISASGTMIQGSHIVSSDHARDPGSYSPTRIWAGSPTGAFSDAWSTALMLMTPDELENAPDVKAQLSAVYIERNGNIESITAG